MPRFPQSERLPVVSVPYSPESPPDSLWSSSRPIQHSLPAGDLFPHRLYYWWLFYNSRSEQENVSFFTSTVISNAEQHGFRLTNCSINCRTNVVPHQHSHLYFRYHLCARQTITPVVLVSSDEDTDGDVDFEDSDPTDAASESDYDDPIIIDI